MKRDRSGRDAAAPAAKAEPFNNPFQKLAAAMPKPASEPTPTTPPANADAKTDPAKPSPAKQTPAPAKQGPAKKPNVPARAVIRYERKGRGGKEVTVVEKLALPPKLLEEWLKSLKTSLGVGGVIEGDTLVLQGDQRDRLRALLEKRGIPQISVG
jgi:translation initiation factor 1